MVIDLYNRPSLFYAVVQSKLNQISVPTKSNNASHKNKQPTFNHKPPSIKQYDPLYNPLTGVVSLSKAPRSIEAILKKSGALEKLGIPPNAKFGFKVEGQKPLASYRGLVSQKLIEEFIKDSQSNGMNLNETNLMSFFITHNGKDYYFGSAFFKNDESELIYLIPGLKQIEIDDRGTLISNAVKIFNQVRSSSLKVKKPTYQLQDGSKFYKLDNLDPKYQPLVDYINSFQKNDSQDSKNIFLVIKEFQTKYLASELKKDLSILSNDFKKALENDSSITLVNLYSIANKEIAPVFILNASNSAVLFSKGYLEFMTKQKNITEEAAVELALSLFNEYAAAN